MTRLIFLTALLIVVIPSLALGESMDDLVKNDSDGLYYKKFTYVPFTGEVNASLEHGRIENGKLEGPWICYYENSELWKKGDYKNGLEEGPWVFYDYDGHRSSYSGT